MNYQKFFKSTALISNPLCGIDTYKDILNLATGQITRTIRKLVLTGNESWIGHGAIQSWYQLTINDVIIDNLELCTHYKPSTHSVGDIENGEILAVKQSDSAEGRIIVKDTNCATKADFLAFLASEYANGTPVTVWYVLAESTTEQITVPSGLSGTVEGYLTQTGTPTPTDPIYPVANDAVGWYGIKNYVRNTTWQDGSTYSRSGGSWSSSQTKKRSRKKK